MNPFSLSKRLLSLFAISALLTQVAVAGDKYKTRILPDINPDDDIVEVVLYATEADIEFEDDSDQSTRVWTYNGIMPGPTIRADVGNKLIVHFYNYLDEETTVHWHGLELPANMDGSNIAQNPVQPGGYFRYEFALLRAATFWYHPHVRSNEQVEKGLAGALVVRDKAEDKAFGLPKKAKVLVLDDILLDENGQVAEFYPTDPLANASMQVNGREGNVLLVNGQQQAEIKIHKRKPTRLRLVNVSNTRFMRLSLSHGLRMWRIGGDAGLITNPVEIPAIPTIAEHGHDGSVSYISDPDLSKGLLLTPGERADVVFTPTGTEEEIHLEWHDMARGRHSAFYQPDGTIGFGHAHHDGRAAKQILATFEVKKHRKPSIEYIPPSSLRPVTAVDTTGAAMVPVRFGHSQPDANGDLNFFVMMKNGMGLPFDMVTAADAPMVKPNETRIIEVWNMTGGDHNFHLHGFMFQHIDTQFIDMDNPDNNYTVPAAFTEDKDTIYVPRRPGAMMRSRTVMRLAVKFDDTGREGQIFASGKVPGIDTSGGWVFHCHLLEHADRGMMSFMQVVP